MTGHCAFCSAPTGCWVEALAPIKGERIFVCFPCYQRQCNRAVSGYMPDAILRAPGAAAPWTNPPREERYAARYGANQDVSAAARGATPSRPGEQRYVPTRGRR